MANSVIFLKGTAAQYASATKNTNTFYYTTDDAQLYLGEVKLSNAGEIAAAVERIETLEDLVTIINGDETVAGSIKKAVNDAKTALEAKIGNLESLSTTNKGNLVAAINEVLTAVGTGGTAAAVTITTDTTTDGALKSYTVKQGTTTVGVIDIPKDMVVKSGAVVTNPEGQAEGTYIELTLANATEDKIYVNVGTLVDIYKAQANAAQVQLAIDPSTREISATIVAGSITTTELADNAVVTAKIADGNVTKAKLSTAVQASLDLADSALQKADIAEGATNGTIAVEGTDVKVHGLGGAAFVDTNAFDAQGSAAAVQGALDSYIETNDAALKEATDDIADLKTAVGEGGAVADQIDAKIAELDADITSAAVEAGKGIQVQVVEADGKITNVNVTGNYDNAYDAKGAAAQALADAKAEIGKLDVTDTAVEGEYVSAVSETDGKITVTRAALPKLEWGTIA